MWESPITKFSRQLSYEWEGEVLKAVHECGVVVDKDELLKALKYDREQYEKGYDDGYDIGFNANKWIPVEKELPKAY